MTEVIGIPEGCNEPGCIIGIIVRPDGLRLPGDRREHSERPPALPFNGKAHSALAWWGNFPWKSFARFAQQHLKSMLRRISVLHGDEEFAATLRGEAHAAIGAAPATMRVDDITLHVAIAMSALLSSALYRQAASSLVMAQAIGLSDLAHLLALTLANSRLDGMRTHPDKFSEAIVILRRAFRERQDVGDKALVRLDNAAPPTKEPMA